jgi:hypothetical protein
MNIHTAACHSPETALSIWFIRAGAGFRRPESAISQWYQPNEHHHDDVNKCLILYCLLPLLTMPATLTYQD